jgi:hypothetical protein
MAEGRVIVLYKIFLGYERGKDSKPKIVESKAKTFNLIYLVFLKSKTFGEIAKLLNEQRILNSMGIKWDW